MIKLETAHGRRRAALLLPVLFEVGPHRVSLLARGGGRRRAGDHGGGSVSRPPGDGSTFLSGIADKGAEAIKADPAFAAAGGNLRAFVLVYDGESAGMSYAGGHTRTTPGRGQRWLPGPGRSASGSATTRTRSGRPCGGRLVAFDGDSGTGLLRGTDERTT
jgi:hypothetical protein